MDISIGWQLDTTPVDPFDKFICEAIIDGLSGLALEVAPELADLDILADVELTSQCSKGQAEDSGD